MRLLLALVTGLSLLFCASPARAQVIGADPLDPPALLRDIVPEEFVAETAFNDLMAPASIAFSPDGRVFVGQLDGVIKVYDGLQDTTGSVYADLSENVAFHGDRGLIGMTLDPGFTTGRPYLYALYTYDAPIGGTAPRWNDVCPDPPGADRDGCVVSGRLSKVLPNGSEQPIITNEWCQQYSSHSVGDLKFGPDGALYVSGGDGASYIFTDYGQDGSPVNPCGDPPGGVGGAMNPPSAEGGALRSQDARTKNDPTGLNGAILRINPDTGEPLPDNPGTGSVNDRRIIAYGLRNPFRFAFRPGTTDAYIGDVGWLAWEEINRMPDATKVRNYGWPCYEGNTRQAGYEAIGLSICQNLYAEGSAAVERPLYTYNHNAKVAGEQCSIGSSSISGVTFYKGATYPSAYNGALFFADYARSCIWVMFPDANGVPNPDTRQVFVDGARTPVDLEIGPDGELYYADVAGGTIQRVRSINPNQAPTAAFTATPRSGNAPLTVHFDATGSTDPNNDELTYAWDFDNDGDYDDATGATPSRTFTQDGNLTVRLRVSDPSGASDTEQDEITVGTLPTVEITSPAINSSYTVGDTISFSGTATAPDGSPMPLSSLTWTLDLNHCSAINTSSCHVHHINNYVGVRSGTFKYPDHEYPSHITLTLTAQLPSGLRAKTSLRIDPKTVDLTINSVPSGLSVAVGGEAQQTPFTRTVARGSTVGLAAPPNQYLAGSSYGFTSWSDGGQSTHQVTVPAANTTYTVRYTQAQCPNPTGLVGAWGFDEPSGTVAYDASGRGNHGELFGPEHSEDGRYGRSLQFDGVDDFVTVADSSSLDLEGGMTLEAWVNPTQLGTSWRTAMMKEAGGGQLAYALYAHNGTGPSGHVTTASEYWTESERVQPNRWTHLTATYDGSTVRLYVDGTLASSRVAGGAIQVSNGALQIGGNTIWSEWFAGRLDDLRIYNRTLSATEIQADMLRPVTCTAVPETPGLGVSPTSLSFDGDAPAAKTISVANTGSGTLVWNASSDVDWLSVSSASGTGNGTLTVTPDPSGLPAGTHTGTITLSAPGATGSPVSIPVTLAVSAPAALSVTPSALAFEAHVGDETVETKAINVTNDGGGELEFEASTSNPWLSLDPGSARAPYTVSVTPVLDGLDPGTYTGAVEIAAGAAHKTVPVSFTVDAAAGCVTPAGLVGAWGFDETSGTAAADASGAGRTGTISGASRTASGRFGRALRFDGVDDLVTVADADALDLTDGLTLSAWVNPDQVSGQWRTVVLKERAETMSYGLYAGTDSHAGGVVSTPHEQSAKSSSALPVGVWSHLATTYDGTTLRLYVNGVQVATRAVGGEAVTGDGELAIGGNSLWDEWFDGVVDEVRVYDHAQTPEAIRADMAAPVQCAGAPPKPALSVAPAGLTFNAVQDGTRPAAQSLAVANTGQGTLDWSASTDADWLELDPATGTGDGTITVRPVLDGLAPGTYDAVVTVTADGADGAPKAIPVSFTVDPKPAELAVSVTSLAFAATEGGASPATKTFTVANAGGGTLSWSVADDAAWLAVSPSSGTNSGTVTVTPTLGSLPAGTHTATVTVTAGQSARTIAVTFTVAERAPVLAVTPGSLTFSATEGGTSPAAKTFAVSNAGGGSLAWTASETSSWLAVSPASGTNGGTVTVTPTLGALAAGTYTADITVTGASQTKTVAVTFTVAERPPVLATSPAALSFSATQAGANPAAKTIDVANTGGGQLSWTATKDAAWLSVTPGSGTNAGTITVSAAVGTLAAGSYSAGVTVTAGAQTKTIPVTFIVDAPPPVLAVSPATLAFSATAGGASPAAKTFTVGNTGGGSMSWTASESASWLDISPASGTNGGTVTVTPTLGALAAGTYTTDITVSGASQTKTVAVTFTVAPRPADLTVTPATLTFSAIAGGASPAAKTFAVANAGGGSMSWTASENATWLELSPASGTNGGTVTVTPTLGALAAGTYSADITVTAGAQTKTVAVSFTVTAPVPAGLVAAYGFEETGTTTTDSSGNGNLGTISGATRTTTGRFGNALSFDGVNDWVTVPHATSLNLATGITMSAWVNTAALGSVWRTVLIKEQPGGLIYSLYANEGTGKPSGHLYMSSGGEAETVGPTNTTVNQWVYLTSSWDGTTLRLYVNGTQVASRALAGTLRSSTGVLRIGGNAVWPEWFSGQIDEVRLYSRALTAAEIQGDMNRPVVSPAAP